jgi:steroid delta-isomerase-like uncharacterized protein
MTQPVAVDLIQRYNDAWNRHDIDAIVALHGERMIFDAHVGAPSATDEESVRGQIAALFYQWPDLAFQTRCLRRCGDLVVQEWTATGTLAVRIELGGLVAEPTGRPVRWAGLDLIELEDGAVTRKESYSDVMAILLAVGSF